MIDGVVQQGRMIATTLSLILSAGILRIMAQARASGGAREDTDEESRFQVFVKEGARGSAQYPHAAQRRPDPDACLCFKRYKRHPVKKMASTEVEAIFDWPHWASAGGGT